MTGDALPANIIRLKYRFSNRYSKGYQRAMCGGIASLMVMILKLEEALQNAQILGKT